MTHRVWSPRACAVMALILSVTAVACGGSTQPAQSSPSSNNPPALDDSPAEATASAPSAEVKQGTEAIQAGDFAKARTILEAAAAQNPKDPQAAFYLGVAIEGLGDGKGAAEHYQQALMLDPKLTEASANLSGVLLDSGDPAGALAAANAGLANAPKSPSLLRDRAVALDATDSKAAPDAFKAAVQAAPNDTEIQFLYAQTLAHSGDAPGALAVLKPVTSTNDLAVLASAGRLFGQLKDFQDCIATLDKAIGQKDVAELRVERGVCKHGNRDEKGADEDFAAAIASDPKYAPAHYYLGQSKRASGDKRGAKAELEKAAALDATGGVGAAAKKALAELK